MTATDGPSESASAPSRPRDRRQHLLEAARELLRERGWHSVAIGDIGAAAGISGPGSTVTSRTRRSCWYRRSSTQGTLLWSALPDDGAGSPTELLRAYVDSHAAFVVENPELVELWYQESRHLSEPARTAQRRLQRCYLGRWTDALLECRTDLSPQEARIMMRGAVGMLHSVVHSDPHIRRRPRGMLRGATVPADLRAAAGPVSLVPSVDVSGPAAQLSER